MAKELAKTTNNGLQIVKSALEQFLQMQEAGVAIDQNAADVRLNNYTRLEEGENRFRVVSRPVYGAEIWFRRAKVNEETGEVVLNDDGAPKMESAVKRFRSGDPIIIPSEFREWQKDKARKFIALLVFNYKSGGVECLVVSQSKLFDDLFAKLKFSEDAVNPFKSDLKIIKKFDSKKLIGGKMMDIYSYTVNQTKENAPSAEMMQALQALPFMPDLDAIFDGSDPFQIEDAIEVIDNPKIASTNEQE